MRIRFSVWLVSGYAHVDLFILLAVVIFTVASFLHVILFVNPSYNRSCTFHRDDTYNKLSTQIFL